MTTTNNPEPFLYSFFFFAYACSVMLRDGAARAAPATIQGHKGERMSLQAQFEQAVADSKNLPERPDNMTLLRMYALFKQASAGDANGDRPGFTDMIGRAKYDAWDALKGTSQEEAMQQYISLIDDLKG